MSSNDNYKRFRFNSERIKRVSHFPTSTDAKNTGNNLDRKAQNAPNRIGVLENYNTQVGRLVSRIEAKLTDQQNTGMIGVFGINSDTVLNQALKLVRSPHIFLGRTYSNGRDIYETVSALIFNYFREGLKKYYPNVLSNDYKWEILSNFDKLTSHDDYDDGGLEYLAKITERQNRNTTICEILEKMKRYMFENTQKKFIFSIEVDLGDFNYELLKSLQKITSPDLVIILNSIRSRDIETRILGANTGIYYDDYANFLLQRYFDIRDIINC